jgi:hypothetical protein
VILQKSDFTENITLILIVAPQLSGGWQLLKTQPKQGRQAVTIFSALYALAHLKAS